VVQVAWVNRRLHRAFDRLVQAVGPSWNDLVEVARIIDGGLKATTEREETETQQGRLLKAQLQWHEKIEGIRPRLNRLAQAIKGDVSPFLALIDRVDRVCLATGLDEFEGAIKEEFSKNKEKLSEAFEQVKAIDELDRRFTQPLLDAVTYLNGLEGNPDGDQLWAERDLLQARLVLETFCRQPAQAEAVLKNMAGLNAAIGSGIRCITASIASSSRPSRRGSRSSGIESMASGA
jgi:hypothetical protein